MAHSIRNRNIDDVDAQLIELLAKNARTPVSELSRIVGMSAPSITERVRKLEESGVISGFTIELDPVALGYHLVAIVRIRPLPGQLHIVEKLIEEIPEFVECDKVTGDDCFFARLYLRDIKALDPILEKITDRAETNTSIVKKTSVPRRLPQLLAISHAK